MSTVERRNDITSIALNSLSALVETEWVPRNWSKISNESFNITTVKSLGLASNRIFGAQNKGILVLDPVKVRRLYELSEIKYNETKKVLGMLGPGYEFFIKIYIFNGTDYSIDPLYSIGLEPYNNASNKILIERIALLNSTPAKISMIAWSQCVGFEC